MVPKIMKHEAFKFKGFEIHAFNTKKGARLVVNVTGCDWSELEKWVREHYEVLDVSTATSDFGHCIVNFSVRSLEQVA